MNINAVTLEDLRNAYLNIEDEVLFNFVENEEAKKSYLKFIESIFKEHSDELRDYLLFLNEAFNSGVYFFDKQTVCDQVAFFSTNGFMGLSSQAYLSAKKSFKSFGSYVIKKTKDGLMAPAHYLDFFDIEVNNEENLSVHFSKGFNKNTFLKFFVNNNIFFHQQINFHKDKLWLETECFNTELKEKFFQYHLIDKENNIVYENGKILEDSHVYKIILEKDNLAKKEGVVLKNRELELGERSVFKSFENTASTLMIIEELKKPDSLFLLSFINEDTKSYSDKEQRDKIFEYLNNKLFYFLNNNSNPEKLLLIYIYMSYCNEKKAFEKLFKIKDNDTLLNYLENIEKSKFFSELMLEAQIGIEKLKQLFIKDIKYKTCISLSFADFKLKVLLEDREFINFLKEVSDVMTTLSIDFNEHCSSVILSINRSDVTPEEVTDFIIDKANEFYFSNEYSEDLEEQFKEVVLSKKFENANKEREIRDSISRKKV